MDCLGLFVLLLPCDDLNNPFYLTWNGMMVCE